MAALVCQQLWDPAVLGQWAAVIANAPLRSWHMEVMGPFSMGHHIYLPDFGRVDAARATLLFCGF